MLHHVLYTPRLSLSILSTKLQRKSTNSRLSCPAVIRDRRNVLKNLFQSICKEPLVGIFLTSIRFGISRTSFFVWFASRNSRWTQSILFHRCFHPLNNHNVKSSGYFPIGIQTHCESVYYHSTSVKLCQPIFFSYF